MSWFQFIVTSVATLVAIAITFSWDVHHVPEYPDRDIQYMIKTQRDLLHCPAFPLQGFTAIVTGATSGIGEGTASELYSLGATVIVASRTQKKVEESIEKIKTLHPASPGQLEGSVLDTSDLDSVKSFADQFLARNNGHPELHFLVNNAGIHYLTNMNQPNFNMSELMVSKQGFDQAFATNYLGHFLLTELLLPVLNTTSAISRVVNVASTYHVQSDGTSLVSHGGAWPAAAVPGNTFSFKRLAYSNNKLAQVLHARELSRRLHAENIFRVRAVSLCPGFVSTGMIPQDTGLGRFIHSRSFPPRAGLLAVMGAILEPTLDGGEFVSNFHNIWTAQWWSDKWLQSLTTLHIRPAVVDMLTGWVLFFQAKSYGFHVERTSPEGRDEVLAKNLFDWSRSVLVEQGYIKA